MPVRDFFNKGHEFFGDKWIIVGKGPSFTKGFEIKNENIIALNEAVRELSGVDIAHVIDIDIFRTLDAGTINRNAMFLVVPYYPHINCRPNLHIDTILERGWFPALNEMAERNRLLCYNLSTTPHKIGSSPVIRARWYSAEAAVDLLANMGIKDIKTIGIDGGNKQSDVFKDLKNANEETGYDRQWLGIRRSIKEFNLNFGPYNVERPIRVFVGCSESEKIPFEVLKYSIEKRATMSVKVEPLSKYMELIPEVREKKLKSRTPFSFQRFLIPAICGYKGKAIYLDSDMQVFSDIKELWTKDMQGKPLFVPRGPDEGRRKARFSVMLMDCEKLDWDINEIVGALNDGLFSYEQIMHEMILADFSSENSSTWNSLEHFDESVKLLHYTDFQTQPWKFEKHPLKSVWEKDFREVLKRELVSTELVKRHIDKGYVRTSLLPQASDQLSAS